MDSDISNCIQESSCAHSMDVGVKCLPFTDACGVPVNKVITRTVCNCHQSTPPTPTSNQTDSNGHHSFHNNQVILLSNEIGNINCNGTSKTELYNNSYYNKVVQVNECAMDLKQWQQEGNDINSTIQSLPTNVEIITWIKQLLS